MNIKRFTQLLTFLFISLFISCTSAEDDMENDVAEPISIQLSANSSVYSLGDVITFTVTTNLEAEITSQAKITVNNIEIDGNTYTPANNGSYTFKATYGGLTSESLVVIIGDIVSVKLSANTLSLNIGNTLEFTALVTLKDGSESNVSDSCAFFVNGNTVLGNRYIPTEVEENLKVTAVFNEITSNEVSINVTEMTTIPTSFTQKVVVEDYTGTWCGWCPRVSHAIDLVKAKTDKIFVIKAHNNDSMENEYSLALETANGIANHPTAYINRQEKWTGSQPDNLDVVLDKAVGTTNLGLAVNSILYNEQITISVTTGFTENVSDVKLVVFVLEDKIIASQANYTSFYNGENPVKNFEHNHVIIYSATNVLGDNTQTAQGTHHTSYIINLKGKYIANASNTGVLAMLVNAKSKAILNAQYAKVNVNQLFD